MSLTVSTSAYRATWQIPSRDRRRRYGTSFRDGSYLSRGGEKRPVVHVLPRLHGAHRPRKQSPDIGLAPEIVVLMLTVAGCILFIAYRVLGGSS